MLAALGLLVGTSQAGVIIEHVGDNDPAVEDARWFYAWGGPPTAYADSLGGEAGWRLEGSNGVYAESNLFTDNPGLLVKGWILEARMAFLSPPGGDNDTAFLIQDGTTGVHTFWQDPNWNTTSPAVVNLAAYPGVDVWGDYRIEYDPAGDGGNGDFSFYLNDTFLQTRTRGELEPNGNERIRWSHGGSNDTIWSLVRLTEIPEPASMTLLAIGGLAMLRRRRTLMT
jgi:hypothetical protein